MSQFVFDDIQKVYDLAARLRRPGAQGELRSFDVPLTKAEEAMSLSAAEIGKMIDEMAPLGAVMSQLKLSPELRRLYGRDADRRTALLAWQTAIEQAARRGRPIPGMPKVQDFAAVLSRMTGYSQVARLAAVALGRLLDARLLLGGLGWFHVGRVMKKVVARLEDPQTSREEKVELEMAFGPLLIYKDQLLRDLEDRRQLHAADQTRLEAERKQAEQRTLVADVMHSLRMGWPVALETLIQAATLWKQQQQRGETTPGAPVAAGAAGAAGGVPRILR